MSIQPPASTGPAQAAAASTGPAQGRQRGASDQCRTGVACAPPPAPRPLRLPPLGVLRSDTHPHAWLSWAAALASVGRRRLRSRSRVLEGLGWAAAGCGVVADRSLVSSNVCSQPKLTRFRDQNGLASPMRCLVIVPVVAGGAGGKAVRAPAAAAPPPPRPAAACSPHAQTPPVRISPESLCISCACWGLTSAPLRLVLRGLLGSGAR